MKQDVEHLRKDLIAYYCSDEIRRILTEAVLPYLLQSYSSMGIKKLTAGNPDSEKQANVQIPFSISISIQN